MSKKLRQRAEASTRQQARKSAGPPNNKKAKDFWLYSVKSIKAECFSQKDLVAFYNFKFYGLPLGKIKSKGGADS
jgi:hypothetical protein